MAKTTIISLLMLGQFTNHNDTDAKRSSVTSRSDGFTDYFVTALLC